MNLKKTLLAFSIISGLVPLATFATTYPVTVTDTAGRTVTVNQEPQHIILQDGRTVLSLALLDRDDPFKRVISWNNLLKRQDSGLWDLLRNTWPAAEKILDMGFSDQGQVDLEQVIAKKPDLMIAELRSKSALTQLHVIERLTELHIPIIFIDDEISAIKNVPLSITMLGEVLNKEQEAKEYVTFYQGRLQYIQDTVKKVAHKPVVFIEPIAGKGGDKADCCFTHSHNGWGALVEATGATNIGSELLPGASGYIDPEKIISMNPAYYIMTGSKRPGNTTVPFGYGSSEQAVVEKFNSLAARPLVRDIPAVQRGQIGGVYHHFYNNPYNIIGVEILAKMFYPTSFENMEPQQDYQYIIREFTQIPGDNILLSYTPATLYKDKK